MGPKKKGKPPPKKGKGKKGTGPTEEELEEERRKAEEVSKWDGPKPISMMALHSV